ncbi:unannotated protein [freshwater metagenome]|uniref:Unannotated protein n=1 Tax=freshwater metagenome TaxID=449393 RepID=A0A6J6GL75_9ZZZZ
MGPIGPTSPLAPADDVPLEIAAPLPFFIVLLSLTVVPAGPAGPFIEIGSGQRFFAFGP